MLMLIGDSDNYANCFVTRIAGDSVLPDVCHCKWHMPFLESLHMKADIHVGCRRGTRRSLCTPYNHWSAHV